MKKIISNNKGLTGIDLTVAIIVLTLYTGIVVSLMSNTYKTSTEIQMGANAMSYATIVLEKVDEKAYEEIDDNFVEKLKSSGEVQMNDEYTVEISTSEIEENMFKKVQVRVNYNFNGGKKTIIINKLKIKEIYK